MTDHRESELSPEEIDDLTREAVNFGTTLFAAAGATAMNRGHDPLVIAAALGHAAALAAASAYVSHVKGGDMTEEWEGFIEDFLTTLLNAATSTKDELFEKLKDIKLPDPSKTTVQ